MSRMGACRGALGALAAVALAIGAPAAGAETLTTGCTGLQGAINTTSGHAAHGAGDVVVLNEMCNAALLKTKTGVTVPAESNITIEGAPGTTSGFDGAGVEKPMLRSASSEAVGSLTIRNLTFQHANVTASSGAALQLLVSHLTLAGDTFQENTLHGSIGGAVQAFVSEPTSKPPCPAAAAPPGVRVTSSVFRANKVIGVTQAYAGALDIGQICVFPESVLEGNTFEGNTVELTGNGEALGGAVSFEPGGGTPAALIQRGNVFDSNRIVSASATSNFGGGGEWTEGASVASVGDRFSRNSIPGAGPSRWSWGGGIGILNSSCALSGMTESTLEDGVVTGNSIAAGSGALGGAGIYVGCSPATTHPNSLLLRDSTVTENSAPASGVAGIAGNPGDSLSLLNSIVAGDVGGAETGGFNGAGGSLASAFSDVCAAGGLSPLPGEGNLCVAPHLANEGNPASVDVRETEASPTLDAGANGLVPAGLTTDYFGGPRIFDAIERPGCEAVLPNPPQVDMGAHEYTGTVLRGPAPPCVPMILPHSKFTFPALHVGRGGTIRLSFKALAAGKLVIVATARTRRTIVTHRGGKKHTTHKSETVPYAHATLTSSATGAPLKAGALAVTLKPGRRALSLLRRKHTLRVTLKITFTQPGLLPTAQTKSIFVRYSPPRRAKH